MIKIDFWILSRVLSVQSNNVVGQITKARIQLATNILLRFGKYKNLCRFHADDYVNFLRSITPETQQDQLRQLKRFNVDEDCPVFDGLYSFCQTYAGGSVGGAVKLNHGLCDIAINWAGGLHHAKKCEASGFCYVNDIVLAILELLKLHQVCFWYLNFLLAFCPEFFLLFFTDLGII